jgi:hypothetical protein
MNSLYGTAETVGFPIQISTDQSQLGDSPKLFAAYHVFHRLSVPRHPPCALSSLLSPTTLHSVATYLANVDGVDFVAQLLMYLTGTLRGFASRLLVNLADLGLLGWSIVGFI